jgi:hypothetical protein
MRRPRATTGLGLARRETVCDSEEERDRRPKTAWMKTSKPWFGRCGFVNHSKIGLPRIWKLTTYSATPWTTAAPATTSQLRNSGATAPTSNAKTTPNAIESEMWTIAPVADERADG